MMLSRPHLAGCCGGFQRCFQPGVSASRCYRSGRRRSQEREGFGKDLTPDLAAPRKVFGNDRCERTRTVSELVYPVRNSSAVIQDGQSRIFAEGPSGFENVYDRKRLCKVKVGELCSIIRHGSRACITDEIKSCK